MEKPSEFIEVEVLKPHSYDGVNYLVGDKYECRKRYYRALHALGRIKEYVAPPPPPRRRSTRKTIETPAPVVTTTELSAEENVPDATVSRQRYTRRDLQTKED